MNGLRTAHAIGMLLTAIAIGLLLNGWLRLPIAILCIVCLGLLASAEALRVSAATTAWRNKQ